MGWSAKEWTSRRIRCGVDSRANQGTKLTLQNDLDRKKIKNVPEDLEIIIEEKRAFYESAFFYWSLIAMFTVGVLLKVFFKNFTRAFLDFARTNILKNSCVGFLFVVITPAIIMTLVILIVTIPVAFILLGLYLIFIYLSFDFTGFILGDRVLALIDEGGSKKNPVWPLMIGLVLVVLLGQMPFIGWILSLVIMCIGVGTFIAYLWSLRIMDPKRVR